MRKPAFTHFSQKSAGRVLLSNTWFISGNEKLIVLRSSVEERGLGDIESVGVPQYL